MSTPRAVAVRGFTELASRGASFLSFLFFVAYAGATGYGAWTQVVTIIGFLVPVATLGISNAIVQFYAAGPWGNEKYRSLGKTLSVMALISTSVACMVFFAAPILNQWVLGAPNGTHLLRWGAGLLAVLIGEFTLNESFRARQHYNPASVHQVIIAITTVGTVATMLPLGFSLVAVLASQVIIRSVVVAGMVGWFFKARRDLPQNGARFSRGPLRGMIRIGIALVLSGLGLTLVNLGDRLVIGHYLDPAALGQYAVAMTLAGFMFVVSSPVNMALYPRLVHAQQTRESPSTHEVIDRFHRYIVLLVIPIVFIVLLFAKPAVLLLSKSQWDLDLWILILITGGIALDQLNSPAQYALLATGRAHLLRNLWLGAGGLNVLVNLWAVPAFGMVGAAGVTLGTFILLEIAIFVTANGVAHIAADYAWRTFLGITAWSVIAAWTATRPIFSESTWDGLVLAGTTFLVILIVGAAITKTITKNDLKVLQSVLHRAET